MAKAAAALERRATPATVAAEQGAWEAYTDACALLDECIEPDCHNVTPEHVYCPAHRLK